MVKDHRPRSGLDSIAKRLAPGQYLAQQRVLVIAPFQHGMEQKGQQGAAQHKRRQILLAMPKVVRQMVPLGLEHVGVFVVDLPAPATRLCNVHNVVSRQRMSGETTIVLQLFARFGMDDSEVEPMDRPGIVITS